MIVQLQSSFIGAIALDDYFVAEVFNGANPNYYLLGTRNTFGLHTGIVVLGEDQAAHGFTTGHWDADFAPGAAATVIAFLNHANGVTFDGPSTIGGFVWDPVNALYVIQTAARVDSSAIAAFVSKLYQNTP